MSDSKKAEYDDRKKTIHTLWNEGLSAGQIAARLNTSRNAIMGQVNWLRMNNYVLRKTSSTTASRVNASKKQPILQAQHVPPVKRPQSKPAPAVERAPDVAGLAGKVSPAPAGMSPIDKHTLIRAPGQRDIPIWSEPNTCQWPTWTIDSKVGDCCGIKIDMGQRVPYCRTHMKASYTPPRVRVR